MKKNSFNGKKNKAILLVSHVFYPESFRINDLSLRLAKMGYDVTVLTGNPNYPQGKFYKGYPWRLKFKYEWYHDVKVIRMPVFARGKNKLSLIFNYFSIWFWGHVFVFFTQKKFDLVITYGLSPIFQTSIALHYARKFNVPTWLYLMDFWPFSIQAVDGLKSKRLIDWIGKTSYGIYRRSNKVLISSSGYEEDLIQVGVKKENIYYWPQYHEDFYHPLSRNMKLTPEIIDDDYLKITFTGNIGYGQGIIEFIEYVKEEQVKLRLLKVRFYFIGEGRAKNIITEKIKSNSLLDLIKLIDAKPAQIIPQYLSNSDIALLLIKNDLYLNKVLPAKLSSYVGCKKPVLSISNGEISKFIERNNIGISTNGYEKDQITKCISKFTHLYNTNTLNIFSSKISFDANGLLQRLEIDLLSKIFF
jgi:hypothetical protein